MQSYLDPRSGRTWPLDVPRWCGDAREPLLLTERRGIARDEIASGTRSTIRLLKAALARATSVQVRMPTELVLSPRSMTIAAPTTKVTNSTTIVAPSGVSAAIQ